MSYLMALCKISHFSDFGCGPVFLVDPPHGEWQGSISAHFLRAVPGCACTQKDLCPPNQSLVALPRCCASPSIADFGTVMLFEQQVHVSKGNNVDERPRTAIMTLTVRKCNVQFRPG